MKKVPKRPPGRLESSQAWDDEKGWGHKVLVEGKEVFIGVKEGTPIYQHLDGYWMILHVLDDGKRIIKDVSWGWVLVPPGFEIFPS